MRSLKPMVATKVLIVDDEPAVRDALRRSLAFEGYETALAVDGLDALEKTASYEPDLILLDVLMPRMDGLTAARRLRAAGSAVPILMLTARTPSATASPDWTPEPTTIWSSPSSWTNCSPVSAPCCAAPPTHRSRRARADLDFGSGVRLVLRRPADGPGHAGGDPGRHGPWS